MRDAIVLGYQLQRASGRDITIPEWYATAEDQLGHSTTPVSPVDDGNLALSTWVSPHFFRGYHFFDCFLITDNITVSFLFPYIVSSGTLKTLTFFMEMFKDFQILWHSCIAFLNYRRSTQGGSVRLRPVSSTGRC